MNREEQIRAMWEANQRKRKSLREIEAKINRSEQNMLALVASLFNDDLDPDDEEDLKVDAKYLIVGSWECASGNNPIDVCIYDFENDPCRDECIYCGKPAERK